MSRATLGPEVSAAIEGCLESVDTAFRLSRATLARELTRRLAGSHPDGSTPDVTPGRTGA
jgi:hypothetical protein